MTTRSRTAAKSKPRPDTMTQASTEEEEILQGLEVDVDDDDDDYEDDAVVAEVVEDVGDDVQETSLQQEESGGEKSPVQEEEEMACSPEIVMEDNLQSGGEAEEPVKVAEEETDKGLEASREGLVELEEEEQQEEVDYGTDAVMETAEAAVVDAPEEKSKEEAAEEHVETKSKGFTEEEDCLPVEEGERLTTKCEFGHLDATLDTTFDREGGIISSYSTEGFQYLLSGVRANVGAKAGSKHSFVYEVKVVEILTPLDAPSSSHAHLPQKKHALRVGFATLDGGVLLGAHEDTVCFDFDGGIWQGKHRRGHGNRFGLNETVAVVLNVDGSKEHGNTVSLFKNGVRAGPPVELPERLIGQDLYPTITFKNVRVEANLGYKADDPRVINNNSSAFGGVSVPLPFKIRSFQQSSENDVCVNPWYNNDNGRRQAEAVMVIGLPDEGVFDYVDYFLKQNPYKYIELSERTMFDWLRKSGLKTLRKSASASNDRPGHQYGVKPLDVHTGMLRQLRRFLESAHHQRSVVHVEIEKGLSEAERRKLMGDYMMKKRTAIVCVGHPDAGYLGYVRGLVGTELERRKMSKARGEWKKKMLEYTKRKEEREAQKKRESLMEAAAKARKDAAEEARQKRQEAAARAAAAKKAAEARTSGGGGAGMGDAQGPVGSGQSPSGMENGMTGVAEEEREKGEEEETEPQMPEVEVTSEEITAKMAGGGRFRKMPLPDLTKDAVTTAYLRFSLPTVDEELKPGVPVFDEVRFVWDEEEEARRYLAEWVKNHKIVEKVSSIKGPSEWFTKQLESWAQAKVEWRKLDRMYKDKKTVTKTEGTEEKKESEEEDVWAAEDIDNVDGEQTPLYGRFEAVDWQLLSLRFELHLLCHSFKKDITDPDVVGIHRTLLSYYYLLYFKKPLSPGMCGVKNNDDLLDRLVTDTIMVGEDGVLEAVHEVDTPFSTFVRLTEVARRERQKLVAAGDKSAELVMKNVTESERSEGKGNSGRRRQQSGGSRRGPSDSRWISTSTRGGGGGGGRLSSRPRRSDSSISLRPAAGAMAPLPASTMPYRPGPMPPHRPRSPAGRGPPPPSHIPTTRIDHRPAVPPSQFTVQPPAQPRVVAYNRFSASAASGAAPGGKGGPPPFQSTTSGRPSYGGGNQYNSGYKRTYSNTTTSGPPSTGGQQQQQYYSSNDSPNKRYRGYGEGKGGGPAYWERGAGSSSYGSSNVPNPSYHYRRYSGGPGPLPPPPSQRRY